MQTVRTDLALDIFKLVQVGPHCERAHRMCSNKFIMKLDSYFTVLLLILGLAGVQTSLTI